MLSDQKIGRLAIRAINASGCKVIKNTAPFGTEVVPMVRHILDEYESAAISGRDARIAELERHNNELVKRREFDVRDIKDSTAKLGALERELEEARKDAAMLDWLDNNIFAKDPDDWEQKYGRCRDGKTQMWAIFAPKGIHGSARKIIAAAIKGQT